MSDAMPSHWQSVNLEEICEIVRGLAFPTTDKSFAPSKGTIACLRTTNVQREVEWDDLWFIPERHVRHQEKLVRIGDILISTANSFELVGKVAQVKSLPYPATLGAFISLIRPDDQVNKSFVFYQLTTSAIQSEIREMASTTTNISNVSTGKLRDLRLNIAPLAEQSRIVAEIEKQFTRLDAATAALKRVQANLKRYRASVLKAACEGRLVPTEAELANKEGRDYEPADKLLERILCERRARWEADTLVKMQASGKPPKDDRWKQKYKEPSAPDTTNLPELPGGWCWAGLEQIAFFQNGRPFPSSQYGADGIKLLRPGNLHASGDVIWDAKNTRCLPTRFADENPDLIVRDRELIMNLTAQSLKDEFLGRICITGVGEVSLLNQRLARITPVSVAPLFLLFTLKSWRFRRFVDGLNTGSLIQHMFTSQLADFVVALPPIAEQFRIVGSVEKKMTSIRVQEDSLAVSDHKVVAVRRSILNSAFSGKLVPQDSADETASELLERIHAERNGTSTKPPTRRRKELADA
jgi:type I restriction enzyme S subunit